MKRFSLLLLTLSSLFTVSSAAVRPRLVVNIVVSQMRPEELDRFSPNFSDSGFCKLLMSGYRCDYGRYGFMPSTVASLATLTTGANPSLHGMTGDNWWDYNSSRRVGAVQDDGAASYGSDADNYRVSAQNLIIPTLGDKLLECSPKSKVVTVAGDALSAVILGGTASKEVWWLDSLRAKWTTSTKYMTAMPAWVKRHNAENYALGMAGRAWILSKADNLYLNSRSSVTVSRMSTAQSENGFRAKPKDIARIVYTPSGNDLVAGFAKDAVIYNSLGDDEATDLLNICFDTPRKIEELYGLDSRETEDMYYRLDETLSELIGFISAQCDGRVVFVLTSDHGAFASDTDNGKVFNGDQFEYMVGSFLSATYGKDNWVLGYSDRTLWLNRTLIFNRGLNLNEIQLRLAAFALQFRGVSHALTSTDMVSGSGDGGFATFFRNSYYPKRSGDLMLNLMPGWTEVSEEDRPAKTSTGSVYDYDTRVPLAVSGFGIERCTSYRRTDMRSLVPTLARIMGIPNPIGVETEPIEEILKNFNQRQ